MTTKAKRIFLRIGIVLLAIVTFGLIIRAIFNYTTSKKLGATIARMKSEGKRLSIEEFEPYCRDEDNAALVWKAAEQMFLLKNQAVLSLTFEKIFTGRPIGETVRKQIGEMISRNETVLQLVQAAAKKSCFKYNTAWKRPAYDWWIPQFEFARAINIMRLYSLDSWLMPEKGDLLQTIEHWRAGMYVAQLLLSGPTLINRLVALGILKNHVLVLNEILSEKDIEISSLVNLLKTLNLGPLRDSMPYCLETERAIFLDFIRGPMRGDLRSWNGDSKDKVLAWIFRPVLKSEAVFFLDLWKDIEEGSKLRYYEAKGFRERFEDKCRKTPPAYKLIGNLISSDGIFSFQIKEAEMEARLLAAQLGIGCKIYKNQNGQFPDQLSQLVPDILEKEPVDPFTGRSFIYKKYGSSFIIYSLGANQKDDGGNGTWLRTKLYLEKDDDIAWREKGK
jgi:hypothetical protein